MLIISSAIAAVLVISAIVLIISLSGGRGKNDPTGPTGSINEPVSTSPVAPPVQVGDVIEFGGYKWLVLDVQDGKALILTEDVIDVRAYNDNWYDVTWEDCSLRAWLNNEFYDSFSNAEKRRISETSIENYGNPWYNTYGSAATTDHIFLLSLDEVLKYLGDSASLEGWNGLDLGISDTYNPDRVATVNVSGEQVRIAAERAAANEGNNITYESAIEFLESSIYNAWWWLRTPGFASFMATGVDYDGEVNIFGNLIDSYNGGVRPALWLDQ